MRGWPGRIGLVSLALTAPVLVACGGEQIDEEPMQEPMEQEPAPTQQQETAQTESAEQATTTSLTGLNDSGVSGEVVFTPVDGTLTVAVTASDLGGAGDHPSHIHQGTCDEPGGVVVPLESPSAGQQGTGEAVTQVDTGQLEAGTSYLVMVHNLDGAPVACAEIPESVVSGSM